METKHSKARRSGSIADRTPLSVLMTRRVVCADEDMDVHALSCRFIDLGISGAPVVDRAGRPVGIVSKTDLVRHAFERRALQRRADSPVREDGRRGDHHPTRVRDIMTPIAYSLSPEVSIARAAALMAFEGIHRLPIITEPGGELVGILSAVDVLRWMGEQDGYLQQSTGEHAAVA